MAVTLVFHFFHFISRDMEFELLEGWVGNLGFLGMVLDALLRSIAFHLPEWQVCCKTPSVPTLESRTCPVNVNNQ